VLSELSTGANLPYGPEETLAGDTRLTAGQIKIIYFSCNLISNVTNLSFV
jgi:hypothetical protein